MAMMKCKECGGEVSTKAKACPHCGCKNPTTKWYHGAVGFAIVGVVVLFFIGVNADEETAPKAESTSAQETKPSQPKAAEPSDEECMQDLTCWGQRQAVSAGVYCEAPIEKLAKYKVEWTDGMFEPRFKEFQWDNKDAGTMMYFGDSVKFQNGFGAWENHAYACTFDPIAKKVTFVQAEAGRL